MSFLLSNRKRGKQADWVNSAYQADRRRLPVVREVQHREAKQQECTRSMPSDHDSPAVAPLPCARTVLSTLQDVDRMTEAKAVDKRATEQPKKKNKIDNLLDPMCVREALLSCRVRDLP